jgi:hypothetical protein
VLISSINWNLNSVTRNRESGLIIESAEAADYFAGIFEYDWTDDTTAPFAHFFCQDEYLVNATVMLNASSSSDNVGIVNYTWTLDGAPAAHGPYFTWSFDECGPHTLGLTVRDAWGNSDDFARTFNITMTAPGPDDDVDDGGGNVSDDDGTPDGDDDGNETAENGDYSFDRMVMVLMLLPVLFFIAVLAVVLIRRRGR